MLFTDIPKVTRLAQFALTSSHQRRIPENLAVGMAQLGPVMTFEMVGKVSQISLLCDLEMWTRPTSREGRVLSDPDIFALS